METLPGEQREGRPRARERDEEEGYRGTVVCGKSVHIIRRNRKEEISVGIRRGEGEHGTAGGEGGIICNEDIYIREEDFERIDERLKGKYEVWKFGLGRSLVYRRDTEVGNGPSMSLLESSRGERWRGVIMCGCCELRFPCETDIKLLRRRSKLELTRGLSRSCILWTIQL